MIQKHSIMLIVFTLTTNVNAAVIQYTNKAGWQAAAGSYNSIFFTELPENTFLNDQYSNLGIHFVDGTDFIDASNVYQDGFGLGGGFDNSIQQFDAAITAIGFEFPGAMGFVELYSHGRLIYTSGPFNHLISPFGGLVSTQPFDKVRFHDSGLFIDNLYFSAIPASSGLAMFALAAFAVPRFRRRRA